MLKLGTRELGYESIQLAQDRIHRNLRVEVTY
jgi:hypothetical protein